MESRLISVLIGSVVGAVLTVLTQCIMSKRGLFTYFVRHERIGLSADDAVFGTVRVTWNDTPAANLYSSTIELRNESLRDYEDVIVNVHTNDTILLTESSHIVGTIQSLKWTEAYADKLVVDAAGQATAEQQALYGNRREYRIPTMNRGQVVRLVYLNAASTDKGPSLWLDIVHRGVRLKFRPPQPEVMGVPARGAGFVGLGIGVAVLGTVIWLVDSLWVGATLCLAIGLVAQTAGALAIRLWRWLRQAIGG